MSSLLVRNPYTGDPIAELTHSSAKELSAVLSQATRSFDRWRNSTAGSRSKLLGDAASLLQKREAEFAELICQEAGKPITLAEGEVQRAISVLRWAEAEVLRYSGELLRLDTGVNSRSGFGIHTKFPRGPVLGITPFNFPLNLVIHKIAPAIAAGCPIVIKPSPLTPLTALKCAELFESEPGLVQVVLADDAQTANLTRAPEIKTISFTGSARVGWEIRRQAPEKPTILELGGNAWALVLEDIPREKLVAIAKRMASGGYGYAGQSCISVQNIAVAAPRFDEFAQELGQVTRTTPYGDPKLRSVISGPLIRAEAAHRISTAIDMLPSTVTRINSQAFHAGEQHEEAPANLLSPCLLIHPPLSRMHIDQEVILGEIFGPVINLTAFEDLPQAIATVNRGPFGLQAGVFTQHLSSIDLLYRELNVGGVVINDVPTTRFDHQPYGGVKNSGQGREGIRYAMDEFSESKFLALSSQLPI